MKAYGIFDGGGVKGAALAGCLAAAEEQGVRFLGFGGTSAGSIVATLASVGYTGKELGELLVDLEFNSLLDDGGDRLDLAKAQFEQISRALQGGLCNKLGAYFKARSLLKSLGAELGLYTGEPLKQFLAGRIKAKRPELSTHVDLTFEHLEQAKGLPLKIVASDLTNRKPAVFSRHQTEYGASVLDAVRASTGYPFVFRPVLKNDRSLVDGGLASNLPAFLFEEEFRETRVPAFAFDLVSAPTAAPTSYDLGRYCGDLLATALEASDELLRTVLQGVYHVPIPTPPGIATLDFRLSRDDRKRLFDAGYQEATSFLNGFAPIQRVKQAGYQLKELLRTEYGPPQRFAPVLYGLAKQIEKETGVRNVRAHVMLPTGRPTPTRIVVYGYGMDDDADFDLELPLEAGCSGLAWRDREIVIANLTESAANPEGWGMTREQHAKVPASRKSMMCVPIHREVLSGERDRPTPIGTLTVHTPTPLEKTGWVSESGEKRVAAGKAASIMMSWAYVLYHLLRR
jgi:NTE family protein